MKALILCALLFIAANTQDTWVGNWKVISGCSNSCCCPQSGTQVSITSDASNSSQIHISATWQTTNVCKRLNLNGQESAVLPWPATDTNFNGHPYYDANGFEYWGMISKVQNATIGYITSDQFNRGGSFNCPYQLSPVASEESDLSDLEF